MWINLNNIGIDTREVVAVLVIPDTIKFSTGGKRIVVGNSNIFLKDGRNIKGIRGEEALEVKDRVSKYAWEKVSFQAIQPPTPEEIEKASKTS